MLEELRAKTAGVSVPAVIRFRTLLKCFIPSVAVVSALLASISRLSAHGKPLPFPAAWISFGVLLLILSIFVTQIIVALSMMRTWFRGIQRYAPPVLAWLLHYERFDRSITAIFFLLLVAVTSLQICLS